MTSTAMNRRRKLPVDPTLMVCWHCGYRGLLKSVNGDLVVVHGPGWVCGGGSR